MEALSAMSWLPKRLGKYLELSTLTHEPMLKADVPTSTGSLHINGLGLALRLSLQRFHCPADLAIRADAKWDAKW